MNGSVVGGSGGVSTTAAGEHRFGAPKGARVAALGTGIGAGLLLNGKVYRRAHGVAPELGHLPMVPGGRECSCGKYGCWEPYCTGTALATTAVELLARHPGRSTVLSREMAGDSGSVTGRRVATAARDGDPIAQRAMIELAKWLGDGLARWWPTFSIPKSSWSRAGFRFRRRCSSTSPGALRERDHRRGTPPPGPDPHCAAG